MSSSRVPAVFAIVFGALALLAIPAGTIAATILNRIGLVKAIAGTTPAAILLALIGVSAVRRARYRVEASVSRRGERTVRVARIIVFSSLYVGLVAAGALGVYEVLRQLS